MLMRVLEEGEAVQNIAVPLHSIHPIRVHFSWQMQFLNTNADLPIDYPVPRHKICPEFVVMLLDRQGNRI